MANALLPHPPGGAQQQIVIGGDQPLQYPLVGEPRIRNQQIAVGLSGLMSFTFVTVLTGDPISGILAAGLGTIAAMVDIAVRLIIAKITEGIRPELLVDKQIPLAFVRTAVVVRIVAIGPQLIGAPFPTKAIILTQFIWEWIQGIAPDRPTIYI